MRSALLTTPQHRSAVSHFYPFNRLPELLDLTHKRKARVGQRMVLNFRDQVYWVGQGVALHIISKINQSDSIHDFLEKDGRLAEGPIISNQQKVEVVCSGSGQVLSLSKEQLLPHVYDTFFLYPLNSLKNYLSFLVNQPNLISKYALGRLRNSVSVLQVLKGQKVTAIDQKCLKIGVVVYGLLLKRRPDKTNTVVGEGWTFGLDEKHRFSLYGQSLKSYVLTWDKQQLLEYLNVDTPQNPQQSGNKAKVNNFRSFDQLQNCLSPHHFNTLHELFQTQTLIPMVKEKAKIRICREKNNIQFKDFLLMNPVRPTVPNNKKCESSFYKNYSSSLNKLHDKLTKAFDGHKQPPDQSRERGKLRPKSLPAKARRLVLKRTKVKLQII